MRKPARVAIIDDEESIRRAFLRLLRFADYEAEAFPSALAFLESYDERRPDCIVLDLKMPGINGIDLLRRLCDRGEPIPPVIVITADDESRLEDECIRLGTKMYLRKPVDGKALIACVSGVLR